MNVDCSRPIRTDLSSPVTAEGQGNRGRTAMRYESITMATDHDDADRVRGLLRSVQCPGFRRDIVAADLVKDIDVKGRRVTVRFAPNTRQLIDILLKRLDRERAGVRTALATNAQCACNAPSRETASQHLFDGSLGELQRIR